MLRWQDLRAVEGEEERRMNDVWIGKDDNENDEG